jgi:hypothetical protein
VKRLVLVGVVLAAGIIVGVVFGWIAGLAVVLAAITIPLLAVGWSRDPGEDLDVARNMRRLVDASDADDRDR